VIETDRGAARFFAGRVRDLRRRLERFGSKQRDLSLLAIVLILRDLDAADRDAVLGRLVGLLRPRRRNWGVPTPEIRNPLETGVVH
jgi:hypothetical protein